MHRPKLTAANVRPALHTRHTTGKLLGGVHLTTVDRLVKRGKLRAVKIGSRKMITADSVDELLAAAK